MSKQNYLIVIVIGFITLLWIGMLFYFNSKYETDFIFEALIKKSDVTYLMKLASESDELEKEVYRNQLYKRFDTLYHMTLDYDFRQLHFHLPTGESFLRMHAPEKYGDFLFDIRATVRDVNLEKKYVTGFEEGRIFNGYRFVYPLAHRDLHVGSVEVSISMASVIDVLTQKYPEADIGFILDKKIMTENVFESEQSRYFESYVSEDYVSDRHVFESIVVSETNPKLYQDSEFLDQLKP